MPVADAGRGLAGAALRAGRRSRAGRRPAPASPARAGVAPPASCAAWSGPLRCADDCAPPVGSAFSLLVPGAFSSLIACPPGVLPAPGARSGAPRAVSRSCRLPFGRELDRRRDQLGLVPGLRELGGPLRAQRLVHDLGVDLEDRVHEHLGTRRAAGQVHVDGHDVVDALHDRVVVEHPAGAGAHAHREHPARLGHLVVDLAQHRGHLVAHPAGDDHQVGLPGRGPEDLHAEAGQVVARAAGGHHLDRAARQPERGGPQRRLARPVDQLLDAGQQDAAGQVLFEAHVSP